MKHSAQLSKVFEIIKKCGGEARFVGGAVRDFLLKGMPLENGDIDLAVNLPVEKVAEVFQQAGAKVVTKYATNIVVLKGKVFEITSTRKDENCDGRYAKMIFTPSFEEDSKRRDFTINALYMNEEGKVFDYNGGLDDLKAHKVRFIGNPSFRITEDYLRIWRFFRFSCLYGKGLDEEGFKACVQKKDGLSKLSKERVTAEMMKLLKGEEPVLKFILEKMCEGGILNSDEFNLDASLPTDPLLRLLTLTNGRLVGEFLYTAKQKKFAKLFGEVKEGLKEKSKIYFLYYKLKAEDFEELLILGKALNALPEDFEMPQEMPALPFSSESIMAKGFEGAAISAEFNKRLEGFCQKIS